MRILVTGSDGYLGALLVPRLIQAGHDVVGVDTGFYNEGWLYNADAVTARTLNKDIRHLTADDLRSVEAVVHMAELSNDPTCALAPDITCDINHRGSIRLAGLAKQAGVSRFVYLSSCSVYGAATAEVVTEESPVHPQTAYAKCKVLVEQDLVPLADGNFSPTFLRTATAYGASPRMRFDIVLNHFAGLAWTTKEIKMTSDGTPWRPLVHGLDIAKAVLHVLAAPRAALHNQVLNVGDTNHNYRLKEIAGIIAGVFQGCQLSFGSASAGHPSHRVSFDKIREVLTGFECEWNAQRGAEQLYALFTRIQMPPETFHDRAFTRVKMLEHLLRTQQLDPEFYWRKDSVHG